MSAISSIARALHVILLGLWLGAGVFLMAVVAPDAFGTLSNRTEAAALVAAVVAHFDLFGLVAGPILLLTLLFGWLPMGTKLGVRALAILLMCAGVGASGYWLTPRMHAVRGAMPHAETPEVANTLLLEFGNLHLMSTAVMGVHVALALLLLATSVMSSTPKRRYGIEL